jgi:hypothetical protein
MTLIRKTAFVLLFVVVGVPYFLVCGAIEGFTIIAAAAREVWRYN